MLKGVQIPAERERESHGSVVMVRVKGQVQGSAAAQVSGFRRQNNVFLYDRKSAQRPENWGHVTSFVHGGTVDVDACQQFLLLTGRCWSAQGRRGFDLFHLDDGFMMVSLMNVFEASRQKTAADWLLQPLTSPDGSLQEEPQRACFHQPEPWQPARGLDVTVHVHVHHWDRTSAPI